MTSVFGRDAGNGAIGESRTTLQRSGLLARIADVASTPSRRILLSGEPGMGKSTILREAAASFESAGYRVLTVNPAYAEREIAYNTLWDLLSSVDWESTTLHEDYRTFLQVALGGDASQGRMPPLSVSVAVEALFAHLAADAPVVMLIDDAQWVDPESELVLHRAWRRSRHLPVFVVTTRRSAATEKSPAGELAAADSLEVSGMSVPELAELARTMGTALTTQQLAALHAHTAGNPMWARELIAGGFVAELGPLAVGTIGAPATLRESVDARMRELSPVAADIVSVVALVGRSTRDQLIAVLELDGAPHSAIAEAEDAGLLTISSDAIRVAHPLHASAAVARLAPSRRRQLHAHIARSVDSVELQAQHLHQSEPPGAVTELAALLDRAVESAGRRAAPILAAHFAANAVSRSEPGSIDREHRQLTQAQQQYLAGDYPAAAGVLRLIDPLRFDAARFDLYVSLASTAIALADSVTEASEQRDSLAARIPADRQRAAILAAFAEEDFVAIDEQMRIARGVLDVLDVATTPYAARRAVGVLLRAEIDLGLGVNTELMRNASRDLDRADGALNETAFAQKAFFAKDLDDIASSREGLAELVSRSQARGEEGIASMFSVHAAATEILAEDYVTARAHLDTAGYPFADGVLRPVLLATCGQLMIVDGDWVALEDMLAEQENAQSASAVFRDLYVQALRGLAAHAREDWTTAATHLRRAAAVADDRGLVELGRRFRIDLPLVEALFHTGELEEARSRLDQVRRLLSGLDRPISRIALHRANALDLAADGDVDGALTEATISAELAETAGRKSDRALALLYRARLSRRLRRARSARSDLERAREIAVAAGNRPLLAAIDNTASTTRRGRSVDTLTPAQQRVFDLVRAGQSNPEISAQLFLSVRTVESHVSAIVRKTGAGSRLKLVGRD